MGVWHATYADLIRTRFSALLGYANLLVDDPVEARELAQDATVEVFSRRKSPRDLRTAELNARGWMAAHAPDPQRAAVVLQAIDSQDGDGVRRVLLKRTPDPLPEVSAEQVAAMRQRFVEDSGVYAVPSGGVNTVMAPALRQHRSALLRTTAAVAVGAAAFAAAGFAAVTYLPKVGASAEAPTASASPSSNALTVTWNPQADYEAAVQGFHYPECGEKYAPDAKAVGGVMPKPSVQMYRDPDFGAYAFISAGFETDAEGAHFVLADPQLFVVTLNDVVVYTSEPVYNGMEGYLANLTNRDGSTGMSRASFCDAQVDAAALSAQFGESFNYDTATDEERAEWDTAWEAFQEKWSTFEAGTYKLYEVTPIVFGEQAALGQLLRDDGVTRLQSITWGVAYTALAQDDRIKPYCTGSEYEGDVQCNVPPDVLKEVLTREVDPETVDDTAPGMGISEPVEFTEGE